MQHNSVCSHHTNETSANAQSYVRETQAVAEKGWKERYLGLPPSTGYARSTDASSLG